MVSVYELKPRFQALLRPRVQQLAETGITANQVTISAVILSALHGLWIGSGVLTGLALVLLPLTLFVRMALNAIDGMLAREHGQKSKLGGLLNEVGDIAADAALYLPIAFATGAPAGLVIAAVAMGLVAEYAGAIGPLIGATRRYDGPFGKSDRALFFGAFGVVFGLGLIGTSLAGWWMALGVVLGIVCTANRMRKSLAEAGDG